MTLLSRVESSANKVKWMSDNKLTQLTSLLQNIRNTFCELSSSTLRRNLSHENKNDNKKKTNKKNPKHFGTASQSPNHTLDCHLSTTLLDIRSLSPVLCKRHSLKVLYIFLTTPVCHFLRSLTAPL